MTAIEDDLTRVPARSADMARLLAELPLDETGHIKACGYDDGDGCECVSLRARLAAVLAPIVAAHVAAGQGRAWDEGRNAGVSDMAAIVGWGVRGAPPEHKPTETPNPYRSATTTTTKENDQHG